MSSRSTVANLQSLSCTTNRIFEGPPLSGESADRAFVAVGNKAGPGGRLEERINNRCFRFAPPQSAGLPLARAKERNRMRLCWHPMMMVATSAPPPLMASAVGRPSLIKRGNAWEERAQARSCRVPPVCNVPSAGRRSRTLLVRRMHSCSTRAYILIHSTSPADSCREDTRERGCGMMAEFVLQRSCI